MAASELDPFDTQINRKLKILPKYVINRDVATYENLRENTGYIKSDSRILTYLRSFWSTCSLFQTILNLIPILKWLPKYSIKQNLSGDIISGFTVGVMHIPQGMAYGLLANVSPSVGLYTAFFPVLIYMIFGTSNHISLGTFSVMSLMTLNVVQKHATNKNIEPGENVITPLDVVQAVTFCAAIINIVMFFARLGFLARLLNEPLVNGFTTGAALHVIAAQLKEIFGITVKNKTSPFKIGNTLYYIFSNITNANVYTIIFTCVVLLFMIMMNEVIKPWLKKKCSFPIPAELFCIIIANLIAKYATVDTKYNIEIIGNIPIGLPEPKFPSISLIIAVFTDSIAISVVSFSLCVSLGLLFAKKHSYELSNNQELFALGMSNLMGSVMSCLPIACSLSRSIIQEQTGGVTQISSFVSSVFVLAIILWIGPWFETLPKCVLAGIICVALKAMLTQAKKLKKFCKQGKLQVLNWLITFLGVVILDVEFGLLMGFLFSILTFYISGFKTFGSLLGTVTYFQNDIYVDINHHKNATEVEQIKIYRHCGAINFASVFKSNLYKSLSIDYDKIRHHASTLLPEDNIDLLIFDTLILDLSCCSHLDMAGCEILTEIMHEMKKINVRFFIAAPTGNVYEKLEHSMMLGEGPFNILLTVHDAVLYAQACRIL